MQSRNAGMFLSSALFLVCVLIARPVVASVITIDAANFEEGQDISNAIPGVTLNQLYYQGSRDEGYNLVRSPVIARPNFLRYGDIPGLIGGGGDVLAFNHCFEHGSESALCGNFSLVLELAFENPVDFLAIRATTGYGSAGFLAFDATGAMIGACWNGGGYFTSIDGCSYTETSLGNFDGFSEEASLQLASADISRIWFGYTNSDNGSYVYANRISFGNVGGGSVPAPGPAALFCLGLAGIALRRRLAA